MKCEYGDVFYRSPPTVSLHSTATLTGKCEYRGCKKREAPKAQRDVKREGGERKRGGERERGGSFQLNSKGSLWLPPPAKSEGGRDIY